MADLWNVVSAVGAVGAALFAGVAWFDARGSAKQAAVSARDSADSASEAVTLQRSEVHRSREVVDVAWELDDSDEDGLVTLRHVGSTPAHDVQALVAVGGVQKPVTGEVVQPGECLLVDYSEERRAENIRAQKEWRTLIDAGFITTGSPRWQVSARVTWSSALGTPGVQVLP